jgi:hypothetical protein
MKWRVLTATVAATLVIAQSAQAREHHHRYGAYHRHYVHRYNYETRDRDYAYNYSEARHRVYAYNYSSDSFDYGYGRTRESDESSEDSRRAYRGGIGPRPSAWCGWEMRQLVGRDPGPSFNVARNWARWGRAGPAGVGAVVVWPHHVGKIVGQSGGAWIIESGNDGHRLRTRPRSIGGAIAIRWG